MLCIGPQVCATARPTGRCKHRPLRNTRQSPAGLCRISPSARRQCTPQSAPCGALPVCGTRIMRRMLKHACILRPLHLLRLAFSAAGGGGVRHLALPLPFRAAAACVGADALHRPASLRHRKAHGTMQASSPTDAGQSPAGVWAPSGAAAQKQSRTGALGAGLFCRDAGGPFGGQRPAASGVAVSEPAASGVPGRALAGASSSSPRRHSRCSSSGICSATQVPSSCCVIPSSISG